MRKKEGKKGKEKICKQEREARKKRKKEALGLITFYASH